MSIQFAEKTALTLPLHIVQKEGCEAFAHSLSTAERARLEVEGFTAALGQVALGFNDAGALTWAALGVGDAQNTRRDLYQAAAAYAKLPKATYEIQDPDGQLTASEWFGLLMTHYRYDRYKAGPAPKAQLVAPDRADVAEILRLVQSEALARDLINTPAADLSPADLAQAAQELAGYYEAQVSVIVGAALLEQNFPMIHAVGRAADVEPRLIDITWQGSGGADGPTLTLVGKGVCYDTGGLNLKPGGSMGLMKKDMGGAAATLSLARSIMDADLPIRLRVLIPAVENSVSGAAFRPGDVLTARDGKTVEINNTDAEGRLVLADALAYASEENPDFIVSMATLTGAARVALGPDLPPVYCDDAHAAQAVMAAGCHWADPVWHMPFWGGYEHMIEPKIADLDNAPSGGFAGSITAALFLRRFVSDPQKYMHFDLYGWSPSDKPARPKGGQGQGARALYGALPQLLKL